MDGDLTAKKARWDGSSQCEYFATTSLSDLHWSEMTQDRVIHYEKKTGFPMTCVGMHYCLAKFTFLVARCKI